ncbi:hypothetical protein [Enterococcus faecium]|uniref:Uncharacterized protein n=1 Tax=Enterococcus faecium TaxID=1352 RepID=A0A242BE58_ENTFC|nr:hypothetical protein [Enterococcus faecium]OTN93638.1 hypothetical protein A5810_001514 [Enterococcus faecium]
MKETLEERKQKLLKQQEDLIKKRKKINQDLKKIEKKIENSEKDYLMEMLEQSSLSVEEVIELLGIEDNQHEDDY